MTELVCWARKAVAVSAADGEDAESARVDVEKSERFRGRDWRMLRRREAMTAVLTSCSSRYDVWCLCLVVISLRERA